MPLEEGNGAARVFGSGQNSSDPGGTTTAPFAVLDITAPTKTGLGGATALVFSALTSATNTGTFSYAWDFGDGATSAATAPSHLYNAAGSFTVRVVVSDGGRSATGQTTVTIKSMTGRWTLGTTTNFFDLVQSGTNITGMFVGAGGTQTRPVLSGLVKSTSPQVTFTDSVGIVFTGDVSASADVVSGALNGGGFPNNTAAGITRR